MEDGISGGLQHCHKTCCEKGGRRGRQACRVQRWHHRGDVIFRPGGLVYDMQQVKICNNHQNLQENYNPIDVGYSGQQRMLELVKRNYWWPGIKSCG